MTFITISSSYPSTTPAFTAEFGDHFLTLSTCVYHVEQGRFVVVAKEVEPGDHYLPVQE